MPTDLPREWFARSPRMLDYCRDAAARLAPLERRPQIVHHHGWSESCDGRTHERLGTVEQLRLAGFELDRGMLDGGLGVGRVPGRGLPVAARGDAGAAPRGREAGSGTDGPLPVWSA